MSTQHDSAASERDAQDLARFGYKQELRRTLGVFSSFAILEVVAIVSSPQF